MVGESDPEANRRDITTLLKDGLLKVVERKGKDGKPEYTYEVNNKSAWYKTHSINSAQFGLMAQYVEDFAAYEDTVKYHMSKPMADVLSLQIKNQAEVLRLSIDAKSSETMRNNRNAQTSLVDKYLENRQERIIDVKGELKRSLSDMAMGKEASQASN